MRFFLVDRIIHLDPWQSVTGIKNVSWSDCANEHNRHALSQEPLVFPASLMLEVAFQTVAWFIVFSSDFTLRPVISMVDRVEIQDNAYPGDQLTIEATIERLNDDLARCSGLVRVNDRITLRIENSICHLLAVDKLEDPAVTRARLAQLIDTTLPLKQELLSK